MTSSNKKFNAYYDETVEKNIKIGTHVHTMYWMNTESRGLMWCILTDYIMEYSISREQSSDQGRKKSPGKNEKSVWAACAATRQRRGPSGWIMWCNVDGAHHKRKKCATVPPTSAFLLFEARGLFPDLWSQAIDWLETPKHKPEEVLLR